MLYDSLADPKYNCPSRNTVTQYL